MHALGTINLHLGWENLLLFNTKKSSWENLRLLNTKKSPLLLLITLGRPTLNIMRAQIRTYQKDIIVPTPEGPWSIKGDTHLAQTCYHASNQPPPQEDSKDETDTFDTSLSSDDQL